jgi:carboxyl-terminal processing protease
MGLHLVIIFTFSVLASATELPSDGRSTKLVCAPLFDDAAANTAIEETKSTQKPKGRPTDKTDFDLGNEFSSLLSGIVNNHISVKEIDGALLQKAFRDLPEVMDPTRVLFLEGDIRFFRTIEMQATGNLTMDIVEKKDYSKLIQLVKTLEQRREEVFQNIDFLMNSPSQRYLILKIAANRSSTQPTVSVGDKPRSFEEARDYVFENWAKNKEQELMHLKITLANMMIPYLNAKMVPEAALQVAMMRLKRRLREDESLRGDPRIYMYLAKAVFGNLDPHSQYASPKEYSEYNIKTAGTTPIGINAIDAVDGILVMSVVPGSLSAVAGLKAGDVITRINNNDTTRFGLDGLTKFMRAQPPKLRLQVLRDEMLLNFELNREAEAYVGQYPVPRPRIAQRAGLRLGVLRFDSFYHGVATHVKLRVEELNQHGTDGLVIDLRRNTGGSLFDASQIARLFVNSKEPMWYYRYSDRIRTSTEYHYEKDPSVAYSQVYQKPVVILVDTASASASELLASSLRSFGRVVVVGAPTYGKGTSYERFAVETGGLKITTSMFYNRFGESPQYHGVQPDILISAATRESPKESERDHPNAIEPMTIPAMTSEGRPVILGLSKLQANSQARQSKQRAEEDAALAEALEILADSIRHQNT